MTDDKCKPCSTAVTGIMTHINGLIEKSDALIKLETLRIEQTEIYGFTYTRRELEIVIDRHKKWIEENYRRYDECCKTGILPSPKISY